MSNHNYTIGVIGGGVVGQAAAGFFKGAKVYDKFKALDKIEEVLQQDVIFICVPTPYENGFDRSYLEDAFSHFNGVKDKIAVIKSTSLPGTTDYFQSQYPDIKILFNPEFLTEKTAEFDFVNPDKQLVGYTDKSQDAAQSILGILPDAPYKKILPARAAELVKYAINSFYATKVVFGNLLYDIAESLGVDYEGVKSAFVADKRITDSHFEVRHGGYRGFGGKCLPKDLLALVELGKNQGVDVGLLEKVDEMNQKYTSL